MHIIVHLRQKGTLLKMDFYENENLRHLTYLESLFMLPRRGFYQLPKIMRYLTSGIKINFPGIGKTFSIPTQYADMQKASFGILDGQAVFFAFNVVTTIAAAIFTVLASLSFGSVILGLTAGIGSLFGTIFGLLFGWVISGLIAWAFSTFYDRWMTIILKIFLALELVGSVICVFMLFSDILAALTVLAFLGFNIFWILATLITLASSAVTVLAGLYYVKCMIQAEELFF